MFSGTVPLIYLMCNVSEDQVWSVFFCAKFLFIVRSGPPLVGLLSLTEPHWPLTRLSAGLGPSLWPRYAWHRPGPAWAGNWSISRPTFEGTQPQHTPPGQGDAKMLECSRWWGTESWRWLSFKSSTFLLIQYVSYNIVSYLRNHFFSQQIYLAVIQIVPWQFFNL